MGKLTVIAGPMFSGKSTEALRLAERAERAKRDVRIYQPVTDTRDDFATSRIGLRMPSIRIATLSEGVAKCERIAPQLAVFDEAQFLVFDQDCIDSLVEYLRAHPGRDVVVAGLDLDFYGRPFRLIRDLMPYADEVVKLSAVCKSCGSDATRTHWTAEWSPDSNINVGDETYEARCLECWYAPVEVHA